VRTEFDFIQAELELDRQIHRAIADCCGNSRLAAMLEKLEHLAAFMRVLHFDREELARENLAEHRNIWRRHRPRAMKTVWCKFLEDHLNNRQKRLLEHFHVRNAEKEPPPS